MGSGLSRHEDESATTTTASSLPTSSSTSNNATNNNNNNNDAKTPESTLVESLDSKMTMNESKCPMHNKSDGTYSYDWTQLFRAAKVHGPKGSKPLQQENEQPEATKPTSTTTTTKERKEEKGGCPVKHNAFESKEPVSSSGCPVKHDSKNINTSVEYNVYSQPINPTNQMPYNPNQLPAVTQTKHLSTERQSSTIPKGGVVDNDSDDSSTNSTKTWTYPSPQMFYNALVRKGKFDSTQDDEMDMESVVAVHNSMNELTWQTVVEWEQVIHDFNSKTKPNPKLLQFQGRPHDLSPKAQLKHYLFNHPIPFDRHDWIIVRPDNTTQRYVIDYYYNDDDSKDAQSVLIDVRPALDNFQSLYHRLVTMPLAFYNKTTNFEYLSLRPSNTLSGQVSESIKVWQQIQASKVQQQQEQQQSIDNDLEVPKISKQQAQEIAMKFSKMLKYCQNFQRQMDNCKTEMECQQASMGLTLCMGQLLCPIQHEAFQKVLSAGTDGEIETALETVANCVVYQTALRQHAKEQHPNLEIQK